MVSFYSNRIYRLHLGKTRVIYKYLNTVSKVRQQFARVIKAVKKRFEDDILSITNVVHLFSQKAASQNIYVNKIRIGQIR